MRTTRRQFIQGASMATLGVCTTPWVRAADDLVVGATVPITGAFAAAGSQYHNSLRLAQEHINAAGGIKGRKFVIAFEDTQASNSVAVNAYIKLVKQYNPPFIFLSSLSTQVLAMEPEVAKAKIPSMYAGGAVAIHERNNPFLFRVRPADSLGAGAMAYGITDVLKKKRPAILYAQDDYGSGAANALEALLAKLGTPVVAKEAFNPRDNDYSAQLLSVKNKGADVIVTFNYNRDGALILKQRRSLGIELPVISGPGMASPPTLELVEPDDLKDVHVTADTILGDSISADSAEFVRRYVVAYKLRPDTFSAAYYDGAMMLADGLRKVGPDAEKLRAHIAGIKGWKGVARTYSTDAQNNMASTVVLAVFKPGTKETVGVAMYPKA